MANTPHSNDDASETGTVYEASWAPSDPRDKLFDESATRQQKSASFFRIIAAFHPVLNVPVLLYDSFVKLGWKWAIFIWLSIAVFFMFMVHTLLK